VFGSKNGMDRLTETWDTARVAMAPRIAAARDAVGPLVDEASVRVAPIIDRVGPAVDTARTRLRTDVVPAVTAAVESSAPARAEARDRAAAALLALRGETPRRVRRWPIAIGCLVAGGIAGLAVGALNRKMATPVTPTPFPAPTPAPTPTPAATAGQDEVADTTAPYPAGRTGQKS